jgi:hypothetical protein
LCSNLCCAAADAEEDIDGVARITDGRDTGLRQRRDQQRQPQQKQQQQQAQQLLVMPAGPAWVYSLNGVSAALTKESPVSVANLVKMNEDHAAAYPFLSEVRDGNLLCSCSCTAAAVTAVVAALLQMHQPATAALSSSSSSRSWTHLAR